MGADTDYFVIVYEARGTHLKHDKLTRLDLVQLQGGFT